MSYPMHQVPLTHRWQLRLKRLEKVDQKEFLPASLELLDIPNSPLRMILMWSICLLVVCTVTWACLSKVDVYATATGRIQDVGRSKVIQPIEPGKVVEIYVRNGQRVHVGDTLIYLDSTEANAEKKKNDQQRMAAQAEIARRHAAIDAAASNQLAHIPAITFLPDIDIDIQVREQAVLKADLLELHAQLARADSKIQENEVQQRNLWNSLEVQRRLIETLDEQLDIRTRLEKDQWETRASVLDAKQALDREMATRVELEGHLQQATAELNTLSRERDETRRKFVEENTQAMSGAEARKDAAAQDLIKAGVRTEDNVLRSPVDGTVQELAVTTIGQVVTPGQQLMTVVPTSSHVQVEALVTNADIGFIKAGQSAVVKIETFPFTIYGSLKGQVTEVSRDAVDSSSQEALPTSTGAVEPIAPSKSSASSIPTTRNLVFPVEISLNKQTITVDGTDAPLSAGMSATVEIVTSKRRVISYLLSPLRAGIAEAAHER